MATRSSRKSGISEGWTVKTKNENGTVVWVNSAFEEITLHETTVPNEITLSVLAANGIVPQLPTLVTNARESFELDIPDENEEDNALSRVLSRVKASPSDLRSEVRLHRVKSDGKLSYCAKFTVEEYDEGGEELIRGAFGAGTYRVMVYGPSEQDGGNYGKFVRLANQLVEIEPSLVPLNLKSGDGNNQLNGTVAQMMIDRLNQLQARIDSGGVSGVPADPLVMFEQFARIQKLMGGGNNTKSLLETIKELEAVKKFKDDMSPESSDSKTPGMMDLAQQVLEILKPKLAESVSGNLPATIQTIPTVSIPPAIAGAAPAPTPNPTGETDMNAGENFMANVMLGALIKSAQRGEEIEVHAPGLAEKLPDEVLDILELPIWFDSLTELFPQQSGNLMTHRDWFTRLRDRVIALTLEGDDKTA